MTSVLQKAPVLPTSLNHTSLSIMIQLPIVGQTTEADHNHIPKGGADWPSQHRQNAELQQAQLLQHTALRPFLDFHLTFGTPVEAKEMQKEEEWHAHAVRWLQAEWYQTSRVKSCDIMKATVSQFLISPFREKSLENGTNNNFIV